MDGPLKLPNIGSNNEIKYHSLKNQNSTSRIETRAKITMVEPKGKRNLQSYIKSLQAKQNVVDKIAKVAISEER